MSNDEDETLFSESLLEGNDEEELADEESEEARKYLDPDEKPRAQIIRT